MDTLFVSLVQKHVYAVWFYKWLTNKGILTLFSQKQSIQLLIPSIQKLNKTATASGIFEK